MSIKGFGRCPNRILSDIQLESVLTPLLFPRTRPSSGRAWSSTIHDTQPDLKILDVGCGTGRLLAGMLGFPKHILKHLEYTGCEINEAEISETARSLETTEGALLGEERFGNVLGRITLGTWDDFAGLRGEYDFVFMINVLHHIPPLQLPFILSDVWRLVKDNGYLVIHDFYFADYLATYQLERYCKDSIFFGPEHLTWFFAMAPTQTGVYRTIRGTAGDKWHYDLFTFIIQFSNELSKEAYDRSVWYDDYFSFLEMPFGIEASLVDIRQQLAGMPQREWGELYSKHISKCLRAVRRQWHGYIDAVAGFLPIMLREIPVSLSRTDGEWSRDAIADEDERLRAIVNARLRRRKTNGSQEEAKQSHSS